MRDLVWRQIEDRDAAHTAQRAHDDHPLTDRVEHARGHDFDKVLNHDPNELPAFFAMARWLRDHLPDADLRVVRGMEEAILEAETKVERLEAEAAAGARV